MFDFDEDDLIVPLASEQKKRRRKKVQQKAPKPKPVQPVPPDPPLSDYSEEDVLDAIEAVVRATTKSYGYRHLSDIASYLRLAFADFQPARYGCKKLLHFIEKHPERFKVKWSAPAHKGRSHVWVRLSTEPRRKEGYGPPAGS